MWTDKLTGTVIRHLHFTAHESVGAWILTITCSAENEAGDHHEPVTFRAVTPLLDFEDDLDQAAVVLEAGQKMLTYFAKTGERSYYAGQHRSS